MKSISLTLQCALLFLATLVETSSAQPYPVYKFRQVVNSDIYKAFVETLDKKRLDVKRHDTLRLPAFATEIGKVVPGGQADQAGVKPGWLLATEDGIPQVHHKMPDPEGHTQKPRRELIFYTPKGVKKTFTFGPGKIGFSHGNHASPERYLLRNAPRGKWDSHLVVAELAWEVGRHDITETALHWAIKGGMPPSIFSSHWASMLALDRNDFKTSRAQMDAVMGTINRQKKIPHYFLRGLRTLAFAHHDWDALAEVYKIDDSLQGTS